MEGRQKYQCQHGGDGKSAHDRKGHGSPENGRRYGDAMELISVFIVDQRHSGSGYTGPSLRQVIGGARSKNVAIRSYQYGFRVMIAEPGLQIGFERT